MGTRVASLRRGGSMSVDPATLAAYERAQLVQTLTLGTRPAVLVVDFSRGFTDPASPLGADMTAAVTATRRVVEVTREQGRPVLYTTVAFSSHLRDAGIWLQKSPAAADLLLGSEAVEIDPRLDPRDDEPVIVKKGASALFGTNLGSILVAQRVDTVILCGATTSGCVRATVIDLFQQGFPTLVPRDCVADRADAPHEANLFDIHAKYADVVGSDDAIRYLRSLA
ncbi:MAG: maleamate amidohydrolase [Thermoleophilaceae bacterium]|nr:maleamate amidohydrolase [Thermoleophilaceae bacterium]